MKQKHRRALRAGSGNEAKLAIVDRLRTISQRHRLYQVFCDFVELAAICVSSRCDLIRAPARETRYLETVARYARDEVTIFCEALALLQMAYETDSTGMPVGFDDLLGEVFMALEFGNEYAGQFFTPMEVCRLISAATFDRDMVQAAIDERGYVSVGEPACGAGAMVIAAAGCLAEMGIDYRRHLLVTAVDVSLSAVHMAYLQCAFLGIPAVIVHGNSLTLEEYSAWLTPGYVLNGHATRDVRAGRERYLTGELQEARAAAIGRQVPTSGQSANVSSDVGNQHTAAALGQLGQEPLQSVDRDTPTGDSETEFREADSATDPEPDEHAARHVA
jgi:hypothetical protein